jgi:predicted small secreted protein
MMRKLLFSLALLGSLPLIAACNNTVEQEARDVGEARQEARENIAAEQKDVDEAARQGAENVNEQKRDVAEQAARENEKIAEEKRELEEAKRENRNP